MQKIDSDTFITKVLVKGNNYLGTTKVFVIHNSVTYKYKIKYSIERFREIMNLYTLDTNSYD